MFSKVLVANRAEIAVRAFRAAFEHGAKTVAVFPFEDRFSEHRQKADEAYQIGERDHPVRAYLDIDEMIRVAKLSGADAIYPGYGFLSENPDLARACVANGILPFYGPFGDIKDTLACEDQFRNAYLLGCVGAWSLHPTQIDIARRVFSPDVADVRHARRVIAAMGDGTGAVMLDGKMEDDASVKQCRVMIELADDLAARDPELAELYATITTED